VRRTTFDFGEITLHVASDPRCRSPLSPASAPSSISDASAQTLRVVAYNMMLIPLALQFLINLNLASPFGPGLNTVLQAIGNATCGHAQPIDVLGLEELWPPLITLNYITSN